MWVSLCESAIENCKLAVKKCPKNLNAYYCLAEAYSCAEDFKLAIETMKKAGSAAEKQKRFDKYLYKNRRSF